MTVKELYDVQNDFVTFKVETSSLITYFSNKEKLDDSIANCTVEKMLVRFNVHDDKLIPYFLIKAI